MRLILILAFSSCKIVFAQVITKDYDCAIKKDYKKSTYRKYGRINTFDFSDTYYNKEGNLFYVKDSTKKVTGYYGNYKVLEYFQRGQRSARLVYYDTCRTKIKEVHLFYPRRNDAKTVHIEYYDNGARKKKKTTQNNKPTKIISWDEKGIKSVEIIQNKNRYYQ